MNSPQNRQSQVFITGFQSFEIFYIPARQEIVSCFRKEQSFPWLREENVEAADGALERESGQETSEGPDDSIR